MIGKIMTSTRDENVKIKFNYDTRRIDNCLITFIMCFQNLKLIV